MSEREEMDGRQTRSPRRSARRSGQPLVYSQGTVSIARGSTVLRGTGTGWTGLSRLGMPATDITGRIQIEGSSDTYEVHIVNADNLITLKRPFAGESVSDVSYTFIEGSLPIDGTLSSDAAPPAPAPDAPAGPSAPSAGAPVPPPPTASPKAPEKSAGAGSAMAEAVRTIGYALAIALIIRAFLYQPFNIPSSSMVPTLLIGDYIFVSKFAYGFSRHSLPFSPRLFEGRIFGKLPARGDVVVFKLPSDGRSDYIKRVIGLPGDRIQIIDGVLYLNGEAVRRERVEDFVQRDSLGNVRRSPMYRETLPNGASYLTLDMERDSSYDNTGEYVVPPGHLFMMGDNRDNSLDSRAAPDYQYPRSGGVGYVPLENLVGEAEIIFFSTDGTARLWEIWRWPQAIRFGRLFSGIG